MDSANLPVEKPTTDIVGKDAEDLQAYTDAGMPDIGLVTEDGMKKMFDLYLSGKNYRQISGIMRMPKPVVLFLSNKLQWFQKRQDYLTDLDENIRTRIMEARLMSQDFLLQLLQMWHKKIGARMTRYMMTEDEKFSDQINLKEIDRYLKTLELLQKSIELPAVPRGPLVSVNLGSEGATLTRTSQNTVEVTPKEKATDDMLAKWAALRKKGNK